MPTPRSGPPAGAATGRHAETLRVDNTFLTEGFLDDAAVSGQECCQCGVSPGQVVFGGFATAAGATPPALATSYEAESAANTLVGGAGVQSCATCSGGAKIGYVGDGGTLTFGGVTAVTAGTYRVTVVYCDGSSTGRQAAVSANGGPAQTVSFTPTGSFSTVGAATISVPLVAGSNTIEFANPSAYAPDFDRIIVAAAPG